MNKSQKKCIIVHGCPNKVEKAMDEDTRTYDKHWMPWLRQELSKQGIKSELPLMPEPWRPDYQKFKQVMDKYSLDQDTVLVGHSCGCAFLIRYLGEKQQKIAKLILVAPWKIADASDPVRKEFYEFPINPKLKEYLVYLTMFTADDEENDGKKSLEIIKKVLGGKVIELSGRGHYTFNDMGTEHFPELLTEIINF